VGGDVKPGIPFTGDSIFSDPAKVRFVERVAGWVSQSDANNDQIIQEAEVVTTPRSLLDKARVAQTVYENKFLLPFAPTAPTFFLIPGDNQVTVVWGPSPSETEGDPFFAVASQPLNPDNTPNPLYDQNFQRFDVEGYRIYRGRTSAEMELVAQFDYAGTHLTDFTGSFAYPDEDGDGKLECAPELSLTDDCPTFPHEHEIVGNVIQIPEGGRVQLADSGLLILQADTAVSGGGSGFAELSNTGVPFAFVDVGVRNSFTYVYSVTAYDVNSFVSGPSSLESPKVTKRITPRRVGANVAQTALVQGVFGDGGAELSPSGTWPTIDAANGTFPGLIPPANDANFSLAGAFEVLPMGDIALRVDSVTAGFTGGIFLSPAGQPNLHVTISAAGDTARHVIALPEPAFNGSTAASYRFEYPIVPYDSAGARRFGIAYAGDVRLPISYGGRVPTIRRTSGGVSVAFGRFGLGDSADHFLSHSRWLDATGAEPPDPTIVASADSAHHAGRLTGVGRIYAPSAYRSPGVNLFLRGYSYSQTAWYPADFVVTWNADSSITVRDSTHRVTLPFRASGGSGWGFVNVRAFTAAGVTTVHIEDGSGAPDVANVAYHHVYGTPPTCFDDWWAIPCIDLEQKAQFQPVDFNADGTPDGNGIALLVNGEFFIMEMNQIPAAGTRWRLRAVAGNMGATCAGGFSAAMTDCSGYTFTPPAERPSFVPGLTYRISVSRQYDVDATLAGNVDSVHTVPDPYYVANALELTANNKVLKFVKLPSRALIRIYSVSGVLVNVIAHDDISLGGEATWNLRNRNNQLVASGVYFYHVETPEGHTKTGRFTIVTFAP
jgi:hypothetical protein